MSLKKPQLPLREQLLIEPDVQTALLLRAGLYGVSLATYFTVIQYFSQQMQHPEVGAGDLVWQFLDEAIYWGPGLMLLGPLFAYDLLKLSNRFAGPVFRLRREMQRLVRNESEVPISFRDDDYWHDVGTHFNAIRDELMDLRAENAVLKANAAAVPESEAVTSEPVTSEPASEEGEINEPSSLNAEDASADDVDVPMVEAIETETGDETEANEAADEVTEAEEEASLQTA